MIGGATIGLLLLDPAAAAASRPSSRDPKALEVEAPAPADAHEDANRRLQLLKERLRARDASLRTLALCYEAELVDAGPPQKWREQGWWLLHDGEVHTQAFTLEGGDLARLERSSWDGARFVSLIGSVPKRSVPESICTDDLSSFPWTDPEASFRFEIFGDVPGKGSFRSKAYAPTSFGWMLAGESWGAILSSKPRVEALGVERLDGRELLAVRLEMDEHGTADGGYISPWLVWFDDRETLLAVRVANHLQLAEVDPAPPRDQRDLHIILGKQRFARFQQWDVTSSRELGPEVYVASGGRVSYPLRDDLPDVRVRLPESGTIWNESPPESRLAVPLPPYRLHIDHVRGERYERKPPPRKGEHWSAAPYSDLLLVYLGAAAAGAEHESDLATPVFTSLSCGPRALLFLSHVLHSAPPLPVDLAHFLEASEGLDEASLAQLERIAPLLGLASVPVRADLDRIRTLSAAVVVHLGTPEGGHGHYAVARFVEDGVQLFSAPSGLEYLGEAEFRERWSGRALIVAATVEALPDLDGARSSNILLGATCGFLLVSGLVLSLGAKPRPRRSGART